MTCVKTGAHVFLEEYHEFAYGDMHEFFGCHILRVSSRGPEPQNGSDKVHFQVMSIMEQWNDKPYGTIVCAGINNFGYDGQPIKQVLPHVKVGKKQG